jgi:hypothetical protein
VVEDFECVVMECSWYSVYRVWKVVVVVVKEEEEEEDIDIFITNSSCHTDSCWPVHDNARCLRLRVAIQCAVTRLDGISA